MTVVRSGARVLVQTVRRYGDSSHYKVVIAGSGAGGCSVAARAQRTFGHGNVAVIEPAKVGFLLNIKHTNFWLFLNYLKLVLITHTVISGYR